jgi:hypothetical protein
MPTPKQVSDLILKCMRMNTNSMLGADLTELQRMFRGVESDMKLAEAKAQQAALEVAKLKKEIDTLKKKLEEAAARPAPAAHTSPGEPQRVAVDFEWKDRK